MLTIILLVILLLYSVLLLFIISSAFWAFVVTRVPFVPTPSKDLVRLTEYLKLGPEDLVLDIGSGDGRVAFLFEEHGGSRVRAIESGRWMHYMALVHKKLRKSNADLVRGNFFNKGWKDVTVLYCYLYPPLMRRVGEKALEDMKKGTRVVSRDFPIPNLELVDTMKLDGKHDFFIYKV